MKVMLMAKTQLCTKYQLEHTLEPFGAAEPWTRDFFNIGG